MTIDPDKVILARIGPLALNETLVFTWVVMGVIACLVLAAGRGLEKERAGPRRKAALEFLYGFLSSQVEETVGGNARPFLPFLGSLFVFILAANLLEVVPLYHPPTASLSTTAALATAVFIAVPAFGIARKGLGAYLADYLKPSPFMLPFTIISEISRTVSLAVRLFGNIMSECLIVAVTLTIVPLFVPLVFQAFGLLVGVIQAYIFFTLATVFVASAVVAGETGGGKEAH